MRNKVAKYRLNFRKLYILLILVALVIILGDATISFARYVSNNVYEHYLKSQGFYFASSELDGSINLNNNWDGSLVSFRLDNFNDLKEITGENIEYNIACNILNNTSGNLECKLNGTNSNTFSGILQNVLVCVNETADGLDVSSYDQETCENRGYTWIDGNNSVSQYFEVVSSDPNEVIDFLEVEIVVESISPFKKTLTGEFHLIKTSDFEEDVIIKHVSHTDYEELIISNYSYMSKDFFLRWDTNKLKISKGDYFNSSFSSDGYINEIEFKLAKDNTISFVFYKNNPDDVISIDDFIIGTKPFVEAVRITSIALSEYSTGVEELDVSYYSDDTVKINLNLPSDSSTFTYEVTIENTTSNYYYLENIEEVFNSNDLDFTHIGLSLYHEFAPGTRATFYLTYNGNSTFNSEEIFLELKYIYTEGEIYKDDTLNGSTPEMIDGLIPIIYDDEQSEWIKADLVKDVWYNYSEMKWANAASVISIEKENYVNAAPGTIVEMDHITSMLVWIPRYSYTIKDDYGYQSYGGSAVSLSTPGAIDIKFIGEDEIDNGSGEYSGDYPSNYYTSSAFCWGNTCDDPNLRNDPKNDEIKGFWIAKFEASKVDNLLYSKPNMTPMINMNISATFNYVQNLMNGVNGYNNYGYVGYVDAHLIKNTEWGAIAYLSQSKYGKYGNTDYTGANKEIYINNCSTYKTGIGGSTPTQGSTTATCNTNTYETYYGMGASTTGNIYGVYDMVGGTFDRVMGIILDENGDFIPDISGFTELPEARYINIYPYDTYTEGDISPIKGDALTETLFFYKDRYLGDSRFSSTNYYLYHWVYRGGSLFFSNTEANGIFSYTLFNGQADGHHSSRFTIIMYGSVVEEL